MCGVGRQKTKQAGQRGTCQHGKPATHSSGQRGHITSTTWRAATQSLTRCRIRKGPDACVGLGDRQQSKQVRGAHASIAGQHHTSGQRGHIISTTGRTATQSLTCCRIRKGPDACVGQGDRRNQGRLVRGAHASIAGHQHWASRTHNIHHMVGSNAIAHHLQNQEGSRCMCGVGR